MSILLVAAIALSPPHCPRDYPLDWRVQHVELNGKRYLRLGTDQLKALLVGGGITSPPPLRRVGYVTPMARSFRKDGTYVDAGDRDETYGRYKILKGAVWITLPDDHSDRLAFFRSDDGDVAMGSYHFAGCMNVRRVLVEGRSR